MTISELARSLGVERARQIVTRLDRGRVRRERG